MQTNEDVSIKSRLTKLFGKYFLVATLLIMVVIGSISTYLTISKSNSLLNSNADAVVRGTSGWFKEQIGQVNLLAQVLSYEDYVGENFDKSESYMASAILENPSAYAYYFGLTDDRCVFSDGWDVPADYRATERDWYPEAFNNPDKTSVSAAYVDADTGRIVVTISKAIVQKGKTVGVFAADFFVDDLLNMASELSDDSSFAIIVDKDGTVLTHKDASYIPTADADGEMVAVTYDEIGISKDLIEQSERTTSLSKYMYVSEYIADAEVTVVFATSLMSYFGGLIIFWIVSIALIVGVYFITTSKVKSVLESSLEPMAELAAAASDMKNGKLDYKASYSSEDEIGTLCSVIGTSNETIRGYIQDVSDKLSNVAEGDLTVAVTDDYVGDFAPLKESINNIVASMKEALSIISEASDAVHNSASEVQNGAGSLSEDVEKVTMIVMDIDKKIETIQNSFNESQGLISDAASLSDKANEKLEEGNGALVKLVDAMEEIMNKSADISNIIDIINQIATQTNLLALNASIEAARAGEAGRGFAVVAESVRSLAEETASAAAKTTELIQESDIAVQKGNSLVGITSDKMKEIVRITNNVNSKIQNISECIKNETEAVNLVKNSVNEMGIFSANTQATSQECVALSSMLYEQSDNMQEAVKRFTLSK